MIRVFKKIAILNLAALLLVGVSGTLVASALGGTTFNQSNIISDADFDNANSMSTAEIDTFLNTFPDSCISSNNDFSAIEPTGYNASQGFLYDGNVTAGKVIYDAAQAYGINPQLLISMLQMEQSLVSGNSGCSANQYAAAMGYGCTDTLVNQSQNPGVNNQDPSVINISASCVNSPEKTGFSQQIIHAAWFLKFGEQRSEGNVNWAVVKDNWDNSDDPQSCYSGPMTAGTWKRCLNGSSVFFDGLWTIDGSTVYLTNGATAALYWYTPHFSANQNLYTIMTNWFSAPITPPHRSVTLTVNGTPNSIIDYGGSIDVNWSSENMTNCNVQPGNTVGISSQYTLYNIKETAMYAVSCTGQYGDGQAKAVVQVLPPTFAYFRNYLAALEKKQAKQSVNTKGIVSQIDQAEKKYLSGDKNGAKTFLSKTVDSVNDLVTKNKLPSQIGTEYAADISVFTGSWGKSVPSVTFSSDGCTVTANAPVGSTVEYGAHDGIWQRGFEDTKAVPASGVFTTSTGGEQGMTSYGYVKDSAGKIIAGSSKIISAATCPAP